MPRRARVIVPGTAHHVTQCGNNRQQVFYSVEDRRLSLRLLTQHARRYGTHVAGYCLMTNHVHQVVVPQHENSPARTFGRTHAEYAQAVNQSEKRSGHLWQNRFFSCPLDAVHLENALRYVELNPVRAGLALMPWHWPWSSAVAHSLEDARDAVLDGSRHMDKWDYTGWREVLLTGMSQAECDAVRRATHTGEPLGSHEFFTQLERQAGRRLRVLARGRPAKRPCEADRTGCRQELFGVEV
ncbi:MAG TPA: transposase [Bryobacteraceae bacterium]|nr:transposase [Bryobacteraceae bacterium]